MKVCDLPYKRVTLEEASAVITEVIEKIKTAKSADDVMAARDEYNKMYIEFSTMMSLCSNRFSLNMADEFYVKEHDYYDEIGPAVQNLMISYNDALLESKFRPELEKRLSPLVFKKMEVDKKASSPEIVPEMIEENKLVSEYSKLMASLEFEFNGKKMTRAELMKYTKDDDREVRKAAYNTLGAGMKAAGPQIDDIYDRMVKVRTAMARKMGYKSFTEMGYYRMGRLCYGPEEIKTFRKNVINDIVPVVSKLRLMNAEKLGIDKYMVYDNDVVLAGGDPRPIGGKENIFKSAKEMYHDMGPETAAFIDMMLENDAFDVEPRKNKWGGGYCTDFPKYKQPFILANFNGTADDVDVVTHEAGHALNAYFTASNRLVCELGIGGMETAETHSMSMEFFAWKYMDKFFGANAERYRYMHALTSLSFIPYGTMVDHFQHEVYDNPDMTPAERKALWLKLEGIYRPHMSNEGVTYLEEGTRWQYQMHIFENPFYYIDYCLAQTAAFNFLLASRENYDDAFKRYIHFSKQGGEKVWTDLLAEAGFKTPFEPGALSELSSKVEKLLEGLNI